MKPDKSSKDTAKGVGRERRTRTSSVKPLPITMDTVVNTVEIVVPDEEPVETLAPKTPAPDLFSPTPSEPSATRDEGRDTPPPSGLRSVTPGSASLNGASRPSRRARAAVNYAEPNLVSKMRRPTKEMADAISLDARKSISYLPASEDKNATRTVIIKREDSNDSAWNHMQSTKTLNLSEPGSPLGQKGGSVIKPESEHEASTNPSASGRAISALLSSTSRSKPVNVVKDESDIADTVQRMQEIDIYDFKESSPVENGESKTTVEGRGSRRHSSVVGPAAQETVAKRRASRVVAQPNIIPGDSAGGRDTVEKKSGLEIEGQVEAKKERISSRRRSMMV